MYIRVKVHTKAKKEKVVELGEHRFEIFVKEKAEQNRANERLREILAERYQTSPKQIRFVSGQHRPNKIFIFEE